MTLGLYRTIFNTAAIVRWARSLRGSPFVGLMVCTGVPFRALYSGFTAGSRFSS